MSARKPGAMTRAEAAVIARAAKAAKAPSLPDRFWSKVDIRGADECWPWKAAPRKKGQGYGAFWLNGKHQPATRVAWVLTHGEYESGLYVCHECDNPPCCNPKHLFLGTHRENEDDKVSKGRQAYGERNGNARLTPEQIQFIRSHKPPGAKRLANGIAGTLAEQFGVTRQYISEILGNKSWRKL